jgi:hypothetical protein
MVALREELFQSKVQQVKSADTFVDLTCDNISDESDDDTVGNLVSSRKKMKMSNEIIELNDEIPRVTTDKSNKDQTRGHAQSTA